MAASRERPLELDKLCEKLHNDFSRLITGTGSDEKAKCSNFLSEAIAWFVLNRDAGATLEDAVAASIDGGQDNGVDSVFVTNDNIIWLIQSKYKASGFGEPELVEVSNFRDGVKYLIGGHWKRFNHALRKRIPEIKNALDSGVCKVKVVLAYSGTAISDDRRDIFRDLEREFNAANPEFISCHAYGLATLHELHMEGVSAPVIDVDIELKDFGLIQKPYRAFYGRMDAKRITELWSEYKDHLVDRNIRRFKGATIVNEGLIKTLKDEYEHFFYFNNGVTFICKDIKQKSFRYSNRESGMFHVRDLSIINGAQTVGVIAQESAAHYGNHPAEVLATFICLKNTPSDFGSRVTQSRNRQNAVDLDDFAALDERQNKWQNTLRVAGITYLVKRGEDNQLRSDTCFSVREIAPYLACAVTTGDWPDYVVAAKADKKKLFGRKGFVSAKGPLQDAYSTLFSDSLTARRMWRIVQVGRAVLNAVKGRSTEPDPANQPSGTLPAREILANARWMILHVLLIRQKTMLDSTELGLTDAEKQTLSREVDFLASKLVSVIQANQSWGKQARALFENKDDCQTVKNRLMAALAQKNQGQ